MLSALPANAQATRTWVSQATGNDAIPLQPYPAVRTFAAAIGKTFINGEINCLDGRLRRGHHHEIDHHRLHRHLRIGPGERRGRGRAHQHPGERERSARSVRLRGLSINGTGAIGHGRHAHRHRRHPHSAGQLGVRRGHGDQRFRPAGHQGGGGRDRQSHARQRRRSATPTVRASRSRPRPVRWSPRSTMCASTARRSAFSANGLVRANIRNVTLAHNTTGIKTQNADNIINVET